MCEALITWQINAASQPVTRIQDQRWPRLLHDSDISSQRRKALDFFQVLSSPLMGFTSCCFEWQALEHLSVPLLWTQGNERENLNDAASKKKKKKEIKVAVRINEPSESLPSLYFSLASALSLASKYQTVMAYLRDKEDKKKVRLQMISFVNQKSLFIYNGVVGHSDTRLQFQNKRSNFSLQSLNWPDRSPCSQV